MEVYLVENQTSKYLKKTTSLNFLFSIKNASLGQNSPPLVLIPTAHTFPKTANFRSILEHEFVHVNQVIIGKFPGSLGWRKFDSLT